MTRGRDGALFSRFSPAERGTALLAVHAEAMTRRSVFQGLYRRRTYATTGERIAVRFDVEGAPLGSEIRTSGSVTLSASVAGTSPIRTVRVVKDGKIVYSLDPRSDRAAFELVDPGGAPDGSYYYLDLIQVDGEKAISSPVWVN